MATLLDPTSNEQKYSKLTSAVIIGATTADSTRLWVRVYQEGRWTLVVTTAPLTGDLVRLEEKTVSDFLAAQRIAPTFIGSADISQASNLTQVFDIAGLTPDTRYYYAVIADTTDATLVRRRTEIGADTPHSFCTQPAAPREISFGFYSCHDHISAAGDVGAWPHFAEQLADAGANFVIGGGDQAYVDTNGKNGFLDIWTWLKDNKAALLEKFALGGGKYDEGGIELYLLDLYRRYYRVYWNVPALREVYERFPQYLIW
ncbi:MAG: hypothetical protein WBW07_10530, partial [Azonexus sp.]